MADQPRPREGSRNSARKVGRALALSALALGVALGVLVGRFLTPDCAREGCPELDALREYSPPEPPRIYDENGDLVGQLPGPSRIVVDLAEIPEVVREGYIAVEDRRFRRHKGVDLTSALRALVANLRRGSVAQGGSTITMQLARNLFEADVVRWNRFRRKLAEIRLARVIESQLGKDEILALYLNQIYLGDGVYGVEAASRHYFGKPVSQVDTREAALLIGLAKNPEGYDPRQNPSAADERIAIVLDILERENVISAAEAAEARAGQVRLSEAGGVRRWGKNAYYVAAVRRELRSVIPDYSRQSGLRVFTGLDPVAQAAAVDALLGQIHAIESGRWGLFGHGVPPGRLRRTDSSPYLQGMVVAMNPATGLVTTLVGGRDYHHSEFDRAFQARRPPGSVLAPIVYAVALDRGARLSDRISTLARDGPHARSMLDLTLRAALVESPGRAAAVVERSVGASRVARQARRMGLVEISSDPSLLLRTPVVPARVVAALAAFGNGGRRITPHLITRVVDRDGVVLYSRSEEQGIRVLDEGIAFLLLDVMREVAQAAVAQVVTDPTPLPAAGESADGLHDAWFVGMTPSLVAGVWLGFDKPRSIVRGEGENLAVPVWTSFMRVAGLREPVTSWRPPPGVVAIEIDPRSGTRVTRECPVRKTAREYFLKGTEPPKGCGSSVSPDAEPGPGSPASPMRVQAQEPPGVSAPIGTTRGPSIQPKGERPSRESGDGDASSRPADSLARDTVGIPDTPGDSLGIVPVRRDTLGVPADTQVVPSPAGDTLRPPGTPPDTTEAPPFPDSLRGPSSPDTLRPSPDSVRGNRGGAGP